MTMAAETTIVVLGAGINGAAIARELAISGVGVIVVDVDDIASGATAWSTRLIHGGLRYLEYGEVGLVRESLAERNRLARLAPHLVRELPFYLPVQCRSGGLWAAAARLVGSESLARAWRGARGRGSWTVGIGLSIYDLLAAGDGWPRHRMVRAGGDGMPRVDAGVFPYAALYSDAQLLYPERFTVELLVDARDIASAAGTRFEVWTHRQVRVGGDGMVTIGSSSSGGDSVEIWPDAIVNASGAWVDRTLATSFPDPAGVVGRRLIGGTKGSHLVVRCPTLRSAMTDYGVYAEAADGRPVFVLPFGDELVLVGTTDIPYADDPAEARTDAAEIDYLLAAVERLFPSVLLDHGHVQQHYCGVRPLPFHHDDGRSPAGVTRRHLVVRHDTAALPVWSIVGGKLTTCRSLAETTAATVLRTLQLPIRGTSRERPLPGACEGPSRHAAVRACAMLAEQAGEPRDHAAFMAERTVRLFGSRAPAVWRAGRDAAHSGIMGATGLPRACVGFCVREEWGTTLEDLIERRLMLVFDEGLSRAMITAVADALADAGALRVEAVAAAVEDCAVRLESKYGRIVPREGDPVGRDDRVAGERKR